MTSKLAEPYLDSIVENLKLLESVKSQVSARDIENLENDSSHKLPNALRAQLVYYLALIAEGTNVLLGTADRPGLAPDWFDAEEITVCKKLIGLRNVMLHGYLSSANDAAFWANINSRNYQVFVAAISRLAKLYL